MCEIFDIIIFQDKDMQCLFAINRTGGEFYLP